MKKSYYSIITIVLGINTLFAHGNFTMENDSISMGANYINDVYYSFENGEIQSVERQNWDIGFHTSNQSAGIITNDGNGVKLYLYPNSDTAGWNSVDTSGLSTWPVLYNSVDEWENGAFNRHALGHPDYGWGKYNSVSHDVWGDSLYILKLAEGVFKKYWIEKKISVANTWHFKYADLDGSNEVSEILDFSGYVDKNFIYYSMQTGNVLDREPNSDTWDILFTKYMDEVVPAYYYPVTGVFNNINVPANRFTEVSLDFEDWTATPMDSTKSPIGYNWKDLDGMSYVIVDSLVSFVRNTKKNVYKLVFTGFDGSATGNAYFEKSLVYVSSINDITEKDAFKVFPNPANDYVSIEVLEGDDWDQFIITDISGKIVYESEILVVGNTSMPTSNFTNGLYFVTLKSSGKQQVQKLIIQK